MAKSDKTPSGTELVEFTPADTFTGWPFGYEGYRRGTQYTAGVLASAPADYVALLREKNLVADLVAVAAPTEDAAA